MLTASGGRVPPSPKWRLIAIAIAIGKGASLRGTHDRWWRDLLSTWVDKCRLAL